ncbi:MAG: fibronectin type III domain-containing protein [Bacteroidota bacterium]
MIEYKIRSSLLLLFTIITLFFVFTSCVKEEAPVVPKNHKPQIDSIAGKSTVLINSTITLECLASDKEKDKLVVSWLSKRGTFPEGNVGGSVVWKAPSSGGIDTIIVTVSDGKGSTRSEITVKVGTIPRFPFLVEPANSSNEIELTAELVWKPVRNAENYDLQISTDDSFSKLLFQEYGLTRNLQKINGLKSNTIYFWRVRSRNIFGISNWTEKFSFKTVAPPQPPKLLHPLSLTKDVSLNPILSWTKLGNADSYALQVSAEDSFTDLIFNQTGLTDTTLQITGLEFFTTYYWRISAENNYGKSGWSEVGIFSTMGTVSTKPVLVKPNDGAMDVPLSTTLYWDASEYAISYSLQVSEDNSFTNLIYDQEGLKSTELLIKDLKNTKKYYWRINASNNYGTSGWSETYSFTTLLPGPSLYLPEDNTVDVSPSPALYWNAIEGAESYSLQISIDSAFTNLVYEKNGITLPNHQPNNLPTFSTYYWRVRGTNSASTSSWSDKKSFTVSAYFYKGYQYGNQALYNPLYVLLGGGYDMIQVGNRRNVKDFPYKIAAKNVWKNLSSPFSRIKNYGWWNFMKDQVLPLSLNKKNAQFWPNYTLHLIGGGMEYAALEEWYQYNDYPIPGWLSALTVMSYHLINEVAENGNYVGDDVDPIADIYIFDIGGILLFTSESVKRFFSEELNLADWSQQPSFSLRNGELHNNGQFFSVKWKFPFLDSWYAFYYFGTNGVGGISYKFNDGSAISAGFGLAASDLILLDEKTNKKTLGLVGNFGFFYDRNNSLLASLSVTIKTDYMVNVNIYPGIIKIGEVSPGLWGAYNQDGNVIFGFAFSWFPVGAAQSIK